MRFPHGESVTLHRYAGQARNAHGQVVVSWHPDEVVPGVAVAPGSSVEPRDAGSYRVVTQMTLYMPPGVTVDPRDQITVRGVRYGIEGDMSGEWRNPFTGWSPGSAVTLKKVSG